MGAYHILEAEGTGNTTSIMSNFLFEYRAEVFLEEVHH